MSRSPAPRRATKVLFVAAALCTFGAVALGSMVCATDSSTACPNWPGCYIGQVAPEAHLNPVLEFVHRVVAVSTGPLLLTAALVGLRSRDPMVRVLPWVALIGALIAGVLGMLTIKVGISTAAAAFDLAASLVAMLAITVAAVCVLRTPRRWVVTGFAKQAWTTVATLVGFHVLSVFVAGPGSLTRCVGWPVWRLVQADGGAAAQWIRLAVGAVGVVLVVATLTTAMRRRDLRVLAVLVAVLVLVELVLGPSVIVSGAGLVAKGLYAAIAGAILCGMGWIAALASVERELLSEPGRAGSC